MRRKALRRFFTRFFTYLRAHVQRQAPIFGLVVAEELSLRSTIETLRVRRNGTGGRARASNEVALLKFEAVREAEFRDGAHFRLAVSSRVVRSDIDDRHDSGFIMRFRNLSTLCMLFAFDVGERLPSIHFPY